MQPINAEDFVILACTVLIGLQCQGVTDGRTPRRWLRRRSILLSRVKTH